MSKNMLTILKRIAIVAFAIPIIIVSLIFIDMIFVEFTVGMYPTDELEAVSLDNGYHFTKLHPDLPTEWAYYRQDPLTATCSAYKYSTIYILDKYSVLYTCASEQESITFKYEVLTDKIYTVSENEPWYSAEELSPEQQKQAEQLFSAEFKADNDRLKSEFDTLRATHSKLWIHIRDSLLSYV